MYFTISDVCRLDGRRLVGYIDYCADKISKLKLISMSKELNLEVEGCSFWWLDLIGGNKGFTEMKNDLDVVAMALGVGYSKLVYVYVKVSKIDVTSNSDVPIKAVRSDWDVPIGKEVDKGVVKDVEEVDEGADVEGIALGKEEGMKKVNSMIQSTIFIVKRTNQPWKKG